MEKKESVIHLRVSTEHKKLIRAFAEKKRFTISGFLLDLALKKIEREEAKKLKKREEKRAQRKAKDTETTVDT